MKIVFCTLAIDVKNKKKDYLKSALRLASSVLLLTDYKIVILTNKPEFFQTVNSERCIIYDTNLFNFAVTTRRFNHFLKAHVLNLASDLESDYLVYLDSDVNLLKWDNNLISKSILKTNFDITGKQVFSSIGKYLKNPKIHIKELHDQIRGIKYTPGLQETHLIYKNTEKLTSFFDYMFKFENNNLEKGAGTNNIGIYLGLSAALANLEVFALPRKPDHDWLEYYLQYELDHLGKKTTVVTRLI